MASVQDSILGLKERASGNHNWSATCSYYSMVHAGRLICFLAVGDYPMNHKKLREVFSSEVIQRTNTPRVNPGYLFDWLRSFSARAEGRFMEHRGRATQGADVALPLVTEYLGEVGIVGANDRLERFGAVLEASGRLRNDSNYEALLIAHEFHHESITSAFQDLSRHMADGAESALNFAVDAFNGFRKYDPDLPEDKSAYEAFLYEYVGDRIGEATRSKTAYEPAAETRLADVLQRIGTQPVSTQYQDLEDHISRVVFEGKASLMTDFERRVGDLASRVGRSAQGR